jgi:hypothetical protein
MSAGWQLVAPGVEGDSSRTYPHGALFRQNTADGGRTTPHFVPQSLKPDREWTALIPDLPGLEGRFWVGGHGMEVRQNPACQVPPGVEPTWDPIQSVSTFRSAVTIGAYTITPYAHPRRQGSVRPLEFVEIKGPNITDRRIPQFFGWVLAAPGLRIWTDHQWTMMYQQAVP